MSMPAVKGERYTEENKKKDVRQSNIIAAKAVADCIRTSLGPRGMDKMLQLSNGEVLISNDGATILSKMEVLHPAAKMLVDMSKSQDIEAGDGTTTVVVIAGALLGACLQLLQKGIHPTQISEAFKKALDKSLEVLDGMALDVDITNREFLIKNAVTSLNSKVVSQYSSLLAPIAVDAVLKVIDTAHCDNVDLRDIRIIKKLGGTIDDTTLVEGLVFDQKASKGAGGPTRVQNAKIALVQFCISPPKTDLENNVVINDYEGMDRVIREERNYIVKIVKKIKASGCNVLLIQKSILRDAITDIGRSLLAKQNILVVKDVERSDVEFISKTLGCIPIATVDSFTPEKLGKAGMVEEVSTPDGKIVKITGVANPGKTISVLIRGSNKLVIDEADRSIHDALCVIRCLVKKRKVLCGGSAPECEVSKRLYDYSHELSGVESYCIRAYAEALEVVPFTLAENAGLNPMQIVTDLRNRHAKGEKNAGINVRKACITDMEEENVIQPQLVTASALSLATESCRMLLKIDDIVPTR
eukprot:TRINITY_DN15160_c0_g1::TRINITY_DN15160_c0_g1_i1::g.30672::m.30672 TRINITY_DN15160_c0_g1::TRINITY_DN15160_c0_g1_i1::g.30672  ORF type:complete len:547 (+),score=214.91,sp/Q9LV21/TCPD_ARATH/63.21/0.0,Cpn60_TCP1/PF00118.19/5.8e-139 TRINITY_DN15160_c0_g1_i1:58-1641(+)